MTLEPQAVIDEEIIYPESDGLPMADNTIQYRWMVTITGNLDLLYDDQPNVFVAGNLFWYPVKGRPDIRRAPDALVVFGRPKGDRGSYQQWEEAHIPPQVVFEIWSPGNRTGEMAIKHAFYETYGAEEYYDYDPKHHVLRGWQRMDGRLVQIEQMDGWVSPRLRIRFGWDGMTLSLFYPDGKPFLTFTELGRKSNHVERERDAERQARQQAETRATQAETRAAALAAQLRALGIDPDQV